MTYNEFREKYGWDTTLTHTLTKYQWAIAKAREPEFFAANYNGEPVLPEWGKEELEVWGEVCRLWYYSATDSLGTRFIIREQIGGPLAPVHFYGLFADYPEWNKLPSYVWERALREIPGAAAFAVLMV